MNAEEVRDLFKEAMEREENTVKKEDLNVGQTYRAINLRISNTRHDLKVVANLVGVEGDFYFPNRIQKVMLCRTLLPNIEISFIYKGIKKYGQFEGMDIEIL